MRSNNKKRQISKPHQEVHRKRRKIMKTKQALIQEDRIRKLPDDIILRILSFIPIRCAARTSVIATRWKSLWSRNPTLDFSGCKPTDIDRCLCLYRAPKVHSFHIHKLSLDNSPDNNNNNFMFDEGMASDRWVRFAAMHRVEELSLGLPGEELPSSLSECQTVSKLMLRHLKLLNLSGDLRAFKSLVTLCLEAVMIKSEVLNMLILACDLLENLNVTKCIFDAVASPRIYVTTQSRLRNLEITFHNYSLYGLEVVAPHLLFLFCCHEGLACDPSIPRPSSLSWNDDAVSWRRRMMSAEKGQVCVRTQEVDGWLFQVDVGPFSSVEMRYKDLTFFCQFHFGCNK